MTASLVAQGDCLAILKGAPANTFDLLLTDPPYGLSSEPDIHAVMSAWIKNEKYEHNDSGGFMQKEWDAFVPGPEYWREAFRVLKPGSFAFVFAGTRTQDLMSIALRFAGFKIRDVAADWLYGSGFPKSLNVSKAVDKKLGVEGTPEAARFEGFGTALKPGREPIIIAQKPLEGTYAENLLKWGTGALNIDGCRVGFADPADEHEAKAKNQHADFGSGPMTNNVFGKFSKDRDNYDPDGRWPANVIIGDDEAAAALGTFSRFFYCAKVSKRERDVGCESLPLRSGGEATDREDGTAGLNSPRAGAGRGGGVRNRHPTVKPVRLMRYFVRLGCPPGGTVLDCFCGSGSTGLGAVLEGRPFVGIELEAESAHTARLRIAAAEEIRRETEP